MFKNPFNSKITSSGNLFGSNTKTTSGSLFGNLNNTTKPSGLFANATSLFPTTTTNTLFGNYHLTKNLKINFFIEINK